jgi:ribosome recycling factor
MSEEVNKVLSETSTKMDNTIDHLEGDLNKIRAGKATPAMMEGIFVDYYGSNTPIAQVSNINTPDARTITIQPFEKTLLYAIEKSIAQSNLGLNPQNDGNIIRLNLPPLTEERRKVLVKQTKEEGEGAKIAVRNIRKEANEQIKKLVKGGVPEDAGKVGETKVQELTDKYIAKVDDVLKAKEKEYKSQRRLAQMDSDN